MEDNSEHDEAVSPALHAMPTSSHPGEPIDYTFDPGTPKSNRQSVDTPVNRDEIDETPHSHALPVHFVLGNFFIATFSISLIIFLIFFTVTWFAVLQDARSMNDRVLSNVSGVSLW